MNRHLCGLAIALSWGFSSYFANGQTLHPFDLPKSVNAYSTNSLAGVADMNRDGSPDVLVPGIFFVGSYMTAFDEDGNGLSANGVGPSLSLGGPIGQIPTFISMGGGLLDQDSLEDLAAVSSTGSVHFQKNLGSTRLGHPNFAPDVIIDNFLSNYPINPPFVSYSFPFTKVVDFDGDGFQDILVAGAPVDQWSGYTHPGFVGFYKGNGQGGFQNFHFGLTGNVIDAEFADLNNDGNPDHLVVLTETGSVGAFGYELIHIKFVGGSLTQIGFPQYVGPAKVTALEFADVVGDSNNDYILSHTGLSGLLSSAVYYYQGDGLGNVVSSSWGTFYLPPNTSGLGDYISSIQVGDFNRDSHKDIALVRGFVQAPSASSPTGQAQYANSEVLVAMGPNLAYATFETIALPGFHRYSWTHSPLFNLEPLRSEPESIQLFDLGGETGMDLLIPGLYSIVGASSTTNIITIKNLTPPQPGDAYFEKVGNPSGGVASSPARIGFEGGRPVPGNSNFACTLSNVQGGCMVGLVWGPLGIANLFVSHGITANLAPAEFGNIGYASGSLAREGFFSYPLPIPNNPSLVGAMGYFQYNYYDHVSNTLGGTQATGLWIGN